MKIYASSDLTALLKEKYVFLDNDFLSLCFHDEQVASFLVDDLSSGHLMIDPLSMIEFLRDIFMPAQIALRTNFLEQPIFLPVANHQELFMKLQQNALLLSKIYAHMNQSNKISFVDLFLAARIMFHSSNAFLITGNKKDFPNCVFDTVAVFNVEQNDGSMKPISIVEFNRDSFENAVKRLEKLS